MMQSSRLLSVSALVSYISGNAIHRTYFRMIFTMPHRSGRHLLFAFYVTTCDMLILWIA